MITMKTINASDLAQRDAFFESLDKRTGETNPCMQCFAPYPAPCPAPEEALPPEWR